MVWDVKMSEIKILKFPYLLNDKYNHDGTRKSLLLSYAKFIDDVLCWRDDLVNDLQKHKHNETYVQSYDIIRDFLILLGEEGYK